MLQVSIINPTGPPCSRSATHLVATLQRGCVSLTSVAGATRVSNWSEGDSLPVATPGSSRAQGLQVVLEQCTRSADAGIHAHMVALTVDPFWQLGMSTWRASSRHRLVPHFIRVDLPAFTLEDPCRLAAILDGMGAYLQGDHLDAIQHFDWAIEAHRTAGHSLPALEYWCGLAHLGAGQRCGQHEHFVSATRHLAAAYDRSTHGQEPSLVAARFQALARSHFQRPAADPRLDYPVALSCLAKGLSALDADLYPVDHARLLFDRATALVYMSQGQASPEIDEAEHDLLAALRILRKDRFPLEHSDCLNALGRVRAQRQSSHRTGDQRQAQTCYREALRIRKQEGLPWHQAQTLHNLGQLYLQREDGNARRNADTAVAYFTAALSVFTASSYPHRHVQTLAALGRAHLQRNGRHGQDLLDAQRCFEQVLGLVSAQHFPYLYARTQFDLGSALIRQPGSQTFCPEQAAEHLRQTLVVFREDTYPVDRARVLVALGSTLLLTPSNTLDEQIAEALSYFREALLLLEQTQRSSELDDLYANLTDLLLAGPETDAGIARKGGLAQRDEPEARPGGDGQDNQGNDPGFVPESMRVMTATNGEMRGGGR